MVVHVHICVSSSCCGGDGGGGVYTAQVVTYLTTASTSAQDVLDPQQLALVVFFLYKPGIY